MTAVNNTSSNSNSTGNVFLNLNKAQAATSNAQQLQDQFLKLLTTQLQNQDPTNPADSNQMTSQLAQISMVSGIQDLNASMTSMTSAYNAGQSFQAAGLIGHQVLANGDTMIYDGKNAAQAEVTVPDNAGKVTASVYDSQGNLVDTMNLGSPAAGNTMVSWDGTNSNGSAMPSGNYTIVAKATDAKGNSSSLQTATYVTVQSVGVGSSGLSIQTTGGETIAMTDIQQIK
ncbi:MAG: flagellar hook assembly protein FlgD [Burkholderiales bacterium]|nr:flagellar hook assembly protein FlgD [Burkholderiales bacterium]